MSKKGFMMAEVVVVSVIVLVVITGLYVSYNKIYATYNTRLNYYDVTTLYKLGYYRDILIENSVMNDAINKAKTDDVVSIYANGNNYFQLPSTEITENITDMVYLVKVENSKTISENILSNQNINLTFQDYINFLSSSATFKSNYVMLMERCNKKKDNTKNIDDCKYAYLEVYDGNE